MFCGSRGRHCIQSVELYFRLSGAGSRSRLHETSCLKQAWCMTGWLLGCTIALAVLAGTLVLALTVAFLFTRYKCRMLVLPDVPKTGCAWATPPPPLYPPLPLGPSLMLLLSEQEPLPQFYPQARRVSDSFRCQHNLMLCLSAPSLYPPKSAVITGDTLAVKFRLPLALPPKLAVPLPVIRPVRLQAEAASPELQPRRPLTTQLAPELPARCSTVHTRRLPVPLARDSDKQPQGCLRSSGQALMKPPSKVPQLVSQIHTLPAMSVPRALSRAARAFHPAAGSIGRMDVQLAVPVTLTRPERRQLLDPCAASAWPMSTGTPPQRCVLPARHFMNEPSAQLSLPHPRQAVEAPLPAEHKLQRHQVERKPQVHAVISSSLHAFNPHAGRVGRLHIQLPSLAIDDLASTRCPRDPEQAPALPAPASNPWQCFPAQQEMILADPLAQGELPASQPSDVKTLSGLVELVGKPGAPYDMGPWVQRPVQRIEMHIALPARAVDGCVDRRLEKDTQPAPGFPSPPDLPALQNIDIPMPSPPPNPPTPPAPAAPAPKPQKRSGTLTSTLGGPWWTAPGPGDYDPEHPRIFGRIQGRVPGFPNRRRDPNRRT